MKTLLIVENLSNGGAQRVVATVLDKASPEEKLELVVLTNTVAFQLKHFDSNKVTVFDSKRMLFSLLPLYRVLLKSRQHSVFSSLFIVDAIVFYLRLFTAPKGRLVFRSCNFFSKVYASKHSLARKLVLHAYKNADRIICSTESMKQDYISIAPELTKKIVVIPNPVDIQSILKHSPKDANHRWFDEKGTFVFVIVAKLKRQKNVSLAINALSRVGQFAKLLIIGKGPEELMLRSLAAEKGLHDRVDFTGFHPNPYPLMMNCQAFLLCSDYEGFPNVLIEAMACKLPVISTNCPSGPSDIITHNRNGFLIPVGDEHALAERMITLMNDHAIREKMASNNWLDVQQYDSSLIAPRFFQAMNEWP